MGIFLKNKKNNKNISEFLETETISTLNLPEWVSLVDIPNKNEKSIDSEIISETSTADLEMKLRNIFKKSNQNGGGENVELVLNGKKKSKHNLMSVTKKVSKKNTKLVSGKKTSKKLSKKLSGGGSCDKNKVSKKLSGGGSCHTKKSSKKKMSKKKVGKKVSKKTSKKAKRSKKSSKKSSKKKSKKTSKKTSKKAKRSKKKII